MAIQTEQDDGLSVAQRNLQMLSQFDAVKEGEIKQASAAGTNMIRRRIREEGFARRILPPQTVTNEDLDRALEHDRPMMIGEMEPDSPGALSIPFGASTYSQTYYANKYQNNFFKIVTPEFVKDINELRTVRSDLRQVVTDNSLKDVQTAEDQNFIAGTEEIVGAVNGVGLAGVQQNFEFNGGLTRDTYVNALSVLEDQRVPNGVFLMNRKTAKTFLGWTRDEIGGDLSQDLFQEGLAALKEAKIMGVRHIFTIKRELVADGVVYCYSEPNFLGRFYLLSELTLFIERKKDIIRSTAQEILSITIANVAAVAKITFLP